MDRSNRLNRKFSRVRRQATEKKAMMDKINEAKSIWKSSARLQGQWRGFLVRRALREATETQKKEFHLREAIRHRPRARSFGVASLDTWTFLSDLPLETA